MTAEFYLFDIGVGQSAALKLPNGKWCIFDVGTRLDFSPVTWIASKELHGINSMVVRAMGGEPSFCFLKATVSHHHGDHLGDCRNLFQHGPEYLLTVQGDREYTDDVVKSNSTDSLSNILFFMKESVNGYGTLVTQPNYGGVLITELSLPVAFSRRIGGDANARVNNSSIVTRIDVYGNSILLCGDIHKEAWEVVLKDKLFYGPSWRRLVSNVDVLIAPHHGHKSGYSVDLLNLAKPTVVLVSVQSKNPNVDSRYSQAPVRGITIGSDSYGYISTRQKGHIKITFEPAKTLLGKGMQYWLFGDCALN
jgi:beta-lactamase superfamily II metal-dependent hydrolase